LRRSGTQDACVFGTSGLPVRDRNRSLRFYATYFGFDPTTAQTYPDGTAIVRDADRFDLALHPATQFSAPPAFLHHRPST
jgi:hypothetical protein